MKISHIVEALPLSTAKKYRKAWDPNFHKEVFDRQQVKDKNAYRIYLPFEATPQSPVTVPTKIENFLKTAIPNKPLTTDSENYVQGFAFDPTKPNNKIGIGKVIARSLAQAKDNTVKSQLEQLKKEFDNDPQRKASQKSDLRIVISRHPYDVAGMSTDRGWRSCMHLVDGINRHYVLKDVKQGSIIAYLIKADDLNVNKPLARILIKPYTEKGNPSNMAMMGDAVYGTAPDHFKQVVDDWINKNYNADKSGLYCLAKGLYRDNIPQQMKIVSDADLTQMPIKDVVKMGINDDSTWPRIARTRSDADEIFTQIAEQSDTRAARLIKNIDVARLATAIKKSPQILSRLHTQPPELVDIALKLNPRNIRFVRNRTPQQHAEVIKLIKEDPSIVRSVHQPTPEQIQTAVQKESWLMDWALEKHPQALSKTQIISYLLKAVKDDDVSYNEMNSIYRQYPDILDDPRLLREVTRYMTEWVRDHVPLTPQVAQQMILNSTFEPAFWEESWLYGHERKFIDLLTKLPADQRDAKLESTVVKKYPELVAAFPGIDPAILKKLVKNKPEAIRYMPDPDPELVYLALKNDVDGELTGEFEDDKYHDVWARLIKADPELIDNLENPSESLLKLAASHPKLSTYTARQILSNEQSSTAIKVIILKRKPALIQYVSKPSLALQMAAINADPDVYKFIKPKDRHAGAKAYMAVYRKEMRKPE